MEDIHVLQKLGILRTFDIVKFIPPEDVKKINEECNKLPKKDRQKAFSDKIRDISQSSRDNDVIPGLLTKKTKALRTEGLLRYSINLAKDIQKMGTSKEEQSFIIVSLTKLLELKLKNFNNWKESQGTKEKEENLDDQEEDDREED